MMSQCALALSPMKYTASMMQISVGVRMFICSLLKLIKIPTCKNKSNHVSDANAPAFGGRLTLFCLVSRSPALVHNLPLFTSTINIEYLVKNKTDLV